MISPESVGNFVYLWGERAGDRGQKGSGIFVEAGDQIKYKLIDVQPDKAVIINTQKPDEPIEIGLLTPIRQNHPAMTKTSRPLP